jgi:hypothetical protein
MRHPSGVGEERDSGGELLEREEQLELIGAVLERAARGEGGGLLVEGTAGLGKTALLDAGARMAADRGVRVLRTRGLELELEHPFGAVRRLLAPLEEMGGDLFGGAAALASPVLADSDGGQDVAGFAALHGLYWLVAGVAGRGPVALLVDDAHWLDEASARFVAFLLPRIEELPAALVVARRPDGAGVDAAPDTQLTRLQPLSEPAVARLVAAALDRDDLEHRQFGHQRRRPGSLQQPRGADAPRDRGRLGGRRSGGPRPRELRLAVRRQAVARCGSASGSAAAG